jgi:uncharacterized protein YggT (Ycf19 family)
MPLSSLSQLLLLAIWLMSMAIFVSIIISWLRAAGVRVPYSNPVIRAIDATADVMLRPIRNSFPTAGGGLDFSPMVALVILYILRALVVRLTTIGP